MHWQRGCKPLGDETLGCSEHEFSHDGQEITVDECICNSNLCNNEMGPMETSTTPKITTSKGTQFCVQLRLKWDINSALETVWLTFFLFVYQKYLAKGIMCYYCNSNDGECSEDEYGTLVSCQEDNDHVAHFGDACVIGHTGAKNYI